MGGLIVRALPSVLTGIGGLLGLKALGESIGEGVGDGTKNALMIVGAGAAAYLILKRGK